MTKAEILAQLEKELAPLNQMMGQAADTIVNENVSNYPIFVVHKQEMNMGIPLVSHEEENISWSVNASTLEEFVTKKIISMDKIDDFKNVFKPIENDLCLFVLSELGATFIFFARK